MSDRKRKFMNSRAAKIETDSRAAGVRDKLIRLGSTHPELRPHIRPVLAELDAEAAHSSRSAAAYSDDIIDQVIDRMDFYKVYDKFADQEDLRKLLLEIFEKLAKELEPDRRVKMALNRLINIVNGRVNDRDIRDQAAKAAALLGVKIPSNFWY